MLRLFGEPGAGVRLVVRQSIYERSVQARNKLPRSLLRGSLLGTAVKRVVESCGVGFQKRIGIAIRSVTFGKPIKKCSLLASINLWVRRAERQRTLSDGTTPCAKE